MLEGCVQCKHQLRLRSRVRLLLLEPPLARCVWLLASSEERSRRPGARDIHDGFVPGHV